MPTPKIQLLRIAISVISTQRLAPPLAEIGVDLTPLYDFVKANWDIEGLTDQERSTVLTIAQTDPSTIGLRADQIPTAPPKKAPRSSKRSSTQGQ